MGDPNRDGNYGHISLVEAWESIDGSITAATSIGTVRAGGSIDASELGSGREQ